MAVIDDALLAKYFTLTRSALAKAKVVSPERTHLQRMAADFHDMAARYLSDAEHFAKTGDKVKAFGALNYAHGWLDAGARAGLFDVGHDSHLFTVD